MKTFNYYNLSLSLICLYLLRKVKTDSMVKKVSHQGKQIYKCSVCGFGYLTNDLANKCKDYCTNHGACSLEITKHAVLRG